MLLLALVVQQACAAVSAGASAASAVSAAPAASGVAGHPEERTRIAREREEVQARYAKRERECRERFIVTSCLDDAKAERREALDRLRARQLAFDEARRHARVDERRAELADKAAEDARRETAHAAHAASSAASSPTAKTRGGSASAAAEGASGAAHAPRGRGRAASTTGKAVSHPPESAVTRSQREATNRAAFEARQAEAAAHRDNTLSKTTLRMSQKAPALSLPVPAAPASAASAAARR